MARRDRLMAKPIAGCPKQQVMNDPRILLRLRKMQTILVRTSNLHVPNST